MQEEVNVIQNILESVLLYIKFSKSYYTLFIGYQMHSHNDVISICTLSHFFNLRQSNQYILYDLC